MNCRYGIEIKTRLLNHNFYIRTKVGFVVCLFLEIKSLDSDMQTLVYENYNKFISATDTIRKVCCFTYAKLWVFSITCLVRRSLL